MRPNVLSTARMLSSDLSLILMCFCLFVCFDVVLLVWFCLLFVLVFVFFCLRRPLESSQSSGAQSISEAATTSATTFFFLFVGQFSLTAG